MRGWEAWKSGARADNTLASIDSVIAQEQFAELGPVIAQHVASFIQFYAPVLTVQVTGNGTLKSSPGNGINCSSTFLVPGTYTVTGAGGADIGPFSATITIPTLPTLVGPVNNTTVTRSSGMTVTWTGGGGEVQIEVAAPTDYKQTNGAVAICTAPARAGTFTIPPYVLLALPATLPFSQNGTPAGFIFGSPYTYAPITATGLNLGIIQADNISEGFGYGAGTGGLTLK
jgi:hypothetical protein